MLVDDEFVSNLLLHMRVNEDYDPQKAHDYYIRTRQLKGRKPAVKESTNPRSKSKGATSITRVASARQQAVNSRVASLQKRLGELESLLKDLLGKAKDKNGSTKQTAKQKQSATKSSEKYRNTNKAEIAKKAKAAYDKNPDANLSIEEVRTKINNIRAELKTAIANARQKLSNPQTVKSR